MYDILSQQIEGSFSVFASIKFVRKRDNFSCYVQIMQQNTAT